MAITSALFNIYSKRRLLLLDKSRIAPFDFQMELFDKLVECGRDTAFGKEHGFEHIKSVEDYQKRVPLRDYDSFEPYIERLRNGENYVLWNSRIKWFAKSSGTSSSKSKLIPVTCKRGFW